MTLTSFFTQTEKFDGFEGMEKFISDPNILKLRKQ